MHACIVYTLFRDHYGENKFVTIVTAAKTLVQP